MSLTAAEVAEILRLVEQSTFDELTLEMDGVKLSLKRGAAVQVNGVSPLTAAGWGTAGAAGTGFADAAGDDARASRNARAGRDARVDGTAGLGGAGGGGGLPGAGAAVPGTAGYPAMTPSAARAGAAGGAAAGAAATHAAPTTGAPAHKPLGPNDHDVLSPLLGTFYRSPKPGAPPFVEIGATVEADTVIAIIEVMKLMNTVRAGVRGTVTDIFIADGSLVEFEQPLIRVSKAG